MRKRRRGQGGRENATRDAAIPGPGFLRSEQRATVTYEWIPTTHVRISKRIVTEVQTIEIEVRREELIVTDTALDPAAQAPFPVGSAPVLPEPLVFTLRSEVPTVALTVLPVQRVTVSTAVVESTQDVQVELDVERLRIDSGDTLPPPAVFD